MHAEVHDYLNKYRFFYPSKHNGKEKFRFAIRGSDNFVGIMCMSPAKQSS